MRVQGTGMRELVRRRLPRTVLGLVLAWSGAQTVRAQEDAGQDMDRLREEIAANPEPLDLVRAVSVARLG